MVLLVASMFVLAVMPVGISFGDDDPEPDVIIHVGQEYEYTPIFNVKDVEVEATTTDEYVTITADGSVDGKVVIKGASVGIATVEITGISSHVLTNTSTQEIIVEVIAALEITTTAFTFYKDAAGSEEQVESSNDPDVVYSAKGLPAGLHMDASSTGLIYGKATTVGNYTGDTGVSITATNLKTGMTITTKISIYVVESGSDFELTADDTNIYEATTTGDERYFAVNDVSTFKFTSDEIGGTWAIKASAEFAAAVGYSVNNEDKELVFTPKASADDFSALSGDYAVYIYHTNNGVTTVKHIVIHFQAALDFDTTPVASFVAGYTGAGLVAV